MAIIKIALDQGSTSHFYEGPESKYFRLYKHHTVFVIVFLVFFKLILDGGDCLTML